jgi:hypothetical protein
MYEKNNRWLRVIHFWPNPSPGYVSKDMLSSSGASIPEG